MSGTLEPHFPAWANHLRKAESANEDEFGASDSLIRPDPKVSKSGQQTQSQSNIIILLLLQTLEKLEYLDQRIRKLENNSTGAPAPIDTDELINRFVALVPASGKSRKVYTHRVNVGNTSGQPKGPTEKKD